jgi:hypothetical protein
VIANHRTHLLLPLIGLVVLATAVQGITSFVLTQSLSKAAQRLIARIGRANVSSWQPRPTNGGATKDSFPPTTAARHRGGNRSSCPKSDDYLGG